MHINDRIEKIIWLGEFIREHFNNYLHSEFSDLHKKLTDAIINEKYNNPWFTENNIEYSLKHWGELLKTENVLNWIKLYHLQTTKKQKNILIIAAGNIPLVSFHDVLCVFLTGNRSIVKLSSKDKNLLKLLVEIWSTKYSDIKQMITFTEHTVKNFDAVITTGSNESLKYFESYFGKYPHIFRGHRNSIAILDGTESQTDLQNLSDDVFLYFGLGCRSVSKIFVPQNYDFDFLINSFKKWEHIFYHNYYLNNFEYQKTIYLLNKTPFIDGGFFMLKESENFSSPIGVIFYEYYSDISILAQKIKALSSQIQCIVYKENKYLKTVKFGSSQSPTLWDYADDIDVVNFLISI